MFGACCQLATNEAVIDDYNKPLLNPLETFNGNDNHVAGSTHHGGYGEADTILLETAKPEKTSVYLTSTNSHHGSESITTIGTFNPSKKKIQSTKQPHQTKPTSIKHGSTDSYVLVQTFTNDKNVASSKPANVYDNEISSIESIILMLNDTKTGPQYNTEIKQQTTNGLPVKYGGGSSSSSGNFYITTKLPASSTPNPISTLSTLFQKVPTLTHSQTLTTKSPSTSYVYSTTIPKRPSTSSSNPNRISSTSTASNKNPTKLASATNTKKPGQKLTTRPISTSYVSGPTPARPTYSGTKKPSIISSYTTPIKQHSSNVPVINKIGSSTPAPTVIVLGPYGGGEFFIHTYKKPKKKLIFAIFNFRFNGKSISYNTYHTKTNG